MSHIWRFYAFRGAYGLGNGCALCGAQRPLGTPLERDGCLYNPETKADDPWSPPSSS